MTSRKTECSFITDFEQSMRNALQIIFPNVLLRGCWYHFCAALRKKHLKFGMNALLKENVLAKQIQKMLMSLPLLPKENFYEGYGHIKRCAVDWDLTGDFNRVFSYFEGYWFPQVTTVESSSVHIIYLYMKIVLNLEIHLFLYFLRK